MTTIRVRNYQDWCELVRRRGLRCVVPYTGSEGPEVEDCYAPVHAVRAGSFPESDADALGCYASSPAGGEGWLSDSEDECFEFMHEQDELVGSRRETDDMDDVRYWLSAASNAPSHVARALERLAINALERAVESVF